jgi:SAM-dependent methyltransferase
MTTHLENIRQAELEQLRGWFPAGARVLEIGGGSGFQASILHSWGCQVTSIDLDQEQNPALRYFSRQYYPVQPYDGKTFPFPDASFDIVFSSNMLYHVVPLEPFLREMRRVLRPDGRMVHIVPSTSWRFWTNVAHYVFYAGALVKRLTRSRRPAAGTADSPGGAAKPAASRSLGRLLLAPPLGPAPSSFAELSLFRRGHWAAAFTAAAFRIEACRPGGIFHTGYILQPGLPMESRRRLARYLGSSCAVFVVAPSA